MKVSRTYKLRKQFKGTIYEDSTFSETHWRFVFDGHCEACGKLIGQELELNKAKWRHQAPTDEEIDEGMIHAMGKNHQCPMAMTEGGVIVGRA